MPPRFKIRHRLQACSCIAAILCAWRKALRNRPEPGLLFRPLWMTHNATNDLVAIQNNEIVFRPMRLSVMRAGLFEN